MSEIWAARQRNTNELTGLLADYLFKKKAVSPSQLYGLCKLTWITESYVDINAAYIQSTKIPALGKIFKKDYSGFSINEVAEDISSILKSKSIKKLIINHTGFTNFYKAYRNSSEGWIDKNFSLLLPLFKEARKLKTDEQGLRLASKIGNLAPIPKTNYEGQKMRPAYLLTPVFFALDRRLRFPLINGAKGVKGLLKQLGVKNAPLEKQYTSMVALYGTGGIRDAADLDQIKMDLGDFIETPESLPTKRFLETKNIKGNKELPLKDEDDITTLLQARTITSRRLHNEITNKLKTHLQNFTLFEGHNKNAMFDVLVKRYDGEDHDLLIEVKSSIEIPHIRMAIGQVHDYWFRIKGNEKRHVAILVPQQPDSQIIEMLKSLDIGVLWFVNSKLITCTNKLKCVADFQKAPYYGKGNELMKGQK